MSDSGDDESGAESPPFDERLGSTPDYSSQLDSLPTLATIQSIPSDAASYGLVNFWDEKYMNTPDQFDWYHSYLVLRELIHEYVKFTDNVLILGCGTSRMSEDMHYDGYINITSADWSGVVIDLMREEYSDIPQLQWSKWNAMAMDCEDATFDAVIDKAMLDSVLCGLNPVHDMRNVLNEIERVLKPTGVYLCVSVGTPETRLEYLEDDQYESPNFMSWEVGVHAVPKPAIGRFETMDLNELNNYYYIYTCKKRADLWKQKLIKMGKRRKSKVVKQFDIAKLMPGLSRGSLGTSSTDPSSRPSTASTSKPGSRGKTRR